MNELYRALQQIQQLSQPGFPFPVHSPPVGGAGELSRASVLALISGKSFEAAEILLLKRSSTVLTHPDQVAFPGGGVEDQDQGDLIETALRETREEVGLHRDGIHPIGLLPGLPTVSGGVWVSPVLAFAEPQVRASALSLDAHEVAHASWAPLVELRATRKEEFRNVRGSGLVLPEFTWGQERMWGMTALIFDLILKRYASLDSRVLG